MACGKVEFSRIGCFPYYHLTDIVICSHAGCHLNGISINHVMYADDICLLAHTASAMQYLLDVCYDYGIEHDVLFNPINQSTLYLNLILTSSIFLLLLLVLMHLNIYLTRNTLSFSFCDSKSDGW